jgi:hypothetical protein
MNSDEATTSKKNETNKENLLASETGMEVISAISLLL